MPPLVRKIVPGDVIGRCRIIRELGRGGVGTVYLAAHQTLQIDVAVKILSPSLSMENPALGDRFIREAQLAARIRHPNVIAVMDAAHDEAVGAYYIVMEYVGGGSLSWHLRNGPLPEEKALAIVTGIAQALVVAEDSRVVHRDIKPENIMLDSRGVPKLADLGLAKHIIDSRTSITIGGSFMGTPAYMSPEQARDAKVADTRDDIYSLGASFYECLTGEPPFQGENPYNIMSELLTKPSPRACVLRPDVSDASDLICRKMMAKNRELRYANARELLEDLRLVQAHGDRAYERLNAVNFDEEADAVRREELRRNANYGVETSSDGAYAEPPEPESPPRISYHPSSRRDSDVFGAAVLLIALVLATTLLLVWAGPNQPMAMLKKEYLKLTGQVTPIPAPAPVQPKPTKPKEHAHASAPKPHVAEVVPQVPAVKPPVVPPTNAIATVAPLAGTPTSPVALPVDPAMLTNLDTVPTTAPTPAQAIASDSAFAARTIAEQCLDPALIAATGRAELLKIVGKREPGELAPTTWNFYFYDKGAAGHARIVTVSGGKVVKTIEDLVDFASPYSERMVLPEDKIEKDSGDALQIAQGLVSGAIVSSSELTLMQQKYSVPMWKVTLWGKNDKGDEHRLGDVTLLSESGTPISQNLKEGTP